MNFSSPLVTHLLEDTDIRLRYAWVAVILLVGAVVYTSTKFEDRYAEIPAVGRTGIIFSFIDMIRFMREGNLFIQEGYDKYKPGIFRVPDIDGWHIMVCGKTFIDELLKAPDDVLSADRAGAQRIAGDFTFGADIIANMYHTPVVRNQLTRNLSAVFPLMRDELVSRFAEYIPATDEWSSIKVLDTAMKIISQTSNRVFVGAPICNDPEYVKLTIQFTADVVISARLIKAFPPFMRPLAGYVFNLVSKGIRTGVKHLGPMIEERLANIKEYGLDYPDKPDDLISWLIDEARPEQRTVESLTVHILFLNFAAIHTTSSTFAHILYHLAARPEYIKPIREEVEAVVAKDGWNKVSMTRLRKLDSFIKECQRYDGIIGATVSRIALQEFVFSNGAVIPKGATVSAPALTIHRDEEFYPDGNTFNGFRFSNIRDVEGEDLKNQMVAVSHNYLSFGLGRHACPGRFFLANELKAMLGHLLLTYDIKMADEGVRPPNQWYGAVCLPAPKAEVLFRKRRT